LDACPRGKKWPFVDRRTVLQIGHEAQTLVGAAHTFVAAAVWGTGTGAQSVERRARVLAVDPRRTSETLASVAHTLLDEGPVAAYATLHGNGNTIKALGPSFGTKFLYFAGFDRTPGNRQPLILDQYVATAINRFCEIDLPTTQWSAQQYSDYLDLAHAWADTWHSKADVVERVLFAIGKSSPLAVGVLAGLPLL